MSNYKKMLLKKIEEYSSSMSNDNFSQIRAALYVFNEMILDNFMNSGHTSDLQAMLEELEEEL